MGVFYFKTFTYSELLLFGISGILRDVMTSWSTLPFFFSNEESIALAKASIKNQIARKSL